MRGPQSEGRLLRRKGRIQDERLVTFTFAYGRDLVVSYDERTHWHAAAIYEVTQELHFTRAEVLPYLREEMYVLSMGNGRL